MESDFYLFSYRLALHVSYGEITDAFFKRGRVCAGSEGIRRREYAYRFCTAMFILQEASLSFLGLGVPLEVATWGNILNAAQDLMILKNAWWVWLPTGIIVTLFVIGINFIGDGLRDATDPTQIG